MTVIHDNLGNPIDANNPLPVDIQQTEMIQPIDVQSRLQTTIQTHNAVSVAASSGSNSSWFDCDGFDKIAVTMKSDAATSNNVSIDWSNDGSTVHGSESIAATATAQVRAGILDVKARYYRVYVSNNDTAAHTMSAWAYLKA